MEDELDNLLFLATEELSSLEGVKVYYPNRKLPESPEDVHFRQLILNTDPELLTVCDGGSRHTWILQISVYVRDNVGTASPKKHVDAIRDFFPVNEVFTGDIRKYKVVSPGAARPPVPNDGWYFIPVQFRIQTIK